MQPPEQGEQGEQGGCAEDVSMAGPSAAALPAEPLITSRAVEATATATAANRTSEGNLHSH
ncbi:hypothetical protein ACFVJM_37145 [Streptomyces virginiae]|uniref:hypothetical protein n=1 Tax=Streptomyces virginiae TaxID=1961 RepID=UPI003645BEF9